MQFTFLVSNIQYVQEKSLITIKSYLKTQPKRCCRQKNTEIDGKDLYSKVPKRIESKF